MRVRCGADKKRKVAWLSGGKGAGGKAQQQKPDLSFIDEMIRRSEEKEKRKQEGGGEGDGDGTHSDDEFCLAEYESEDEDERPPSDATATSRGGKDKKGDKSKREMLKGLYLDSQEDDEADGEGEEELHVRKVRTHHTLAFEVAHSRLKWTPRRVLWRGVACAYRSSTTAVARTPNCVSS